MNIEQFNQFCGNFPSTSYVVQWGESHVWKVGGKVFAIGGVDKNHQAAYTFKTSEQNFFFLRECEGYIPAPYLASRGMKWIQQINSNPERDEELEYYIRESFRLVSLGLTKKKQKELGLNQD